MAQVEYSVLKKKGYEMNINKKTENDTVIIRPEGRLDTMTAPELEAQLKECMDGITSLVFDMEELEYLSSAGLRVILSAQKQMNQQGTMVVRNVNEMVMEIFEVTGFADILTIE